MIIQERKIDEIRPYERNPRRNDHAVAGVAESIKRFGFRQPIVVDAEGVIVCGHTRYKAAKALGLATVPCVLAGDLSAKELRAYRILDNKLNELAVWDFDLLGVELGELDYDFDSFNVEFPSFDVLEPLGADEDEGPKDRPERETVAGDGEAIREGASSVYPDGLPEPFPWIGSKARQKNNIYTLIKGVKRRGFVELFGGSGVIMLGKPAEPDEIYNDTNRLLTSFFRTLRDKNKAEDLKRLCDLSPQARDLHSELRELAKAFLSGDSAKIKEIKAAANLTSVSDDVAAAYAIFYAQAFANGGSYLGAFGFGYGRELVETYRNKVDLLGAYCQRFAKVVVENLDWKKALKKYDREGVLIYADPPYECETTDAYETGWSSAETAALVEALSKAKGKVVLSCYDGPAYYRLRDAGFRVKHFHALTTVGAEHQARVESVYYRFGPEDIADGEDSEEIVTESAPERPKSRREKTS